MMAERPTKSDQLRKFREARVVAADRAKAASTTSGVGNEDPAALKKRMTANACARDATLRRQVQAGDRSIVLRAITAGAHPHFENSPRAQSDDPQESSMSKGNDKKPKTTAKTNAGSAYKAAQSQDKQPVSPFAKKPGGGQLGRKGK